MYRCIALLMCLAEIGSAKAQLNACIRINLLGYLPESRKVAVWCSLRDSISGRQPGRTLPWQLVDAGNGNIVVSGRSEPFQGAYGPFQQTCRIDFSPFTHPGKYYLKAGGAASTVFTIGDSAFQGTGDFCLRYMRQQRTGFNPFLNDSCHTHDGYTLYAGKSGIPDSSFIDVTGGWHDASDYLQYASTSANAVYHLLMAARDFPDAFGDEKKANGLDGGNGVPDILDEAKWGLDWLVKMHPQKNLMFQQIGDDRDHMGMRMPGQDTNYYGKGLERPVYFVSGEPQVRGKYLNTTTGTSSIAGKLAAAFALGATAYKTRDSVYALLIAAKAASALEYSFKKRGVSQTASVRAPYIYAEENWVDDMELAFAAVGDYLQRPGSVSQSRITGKSYQDSALHYARLEPQTPWLGKDSASHYQWYPFINLGHGELARQLSDVKRKTVIAYYRQGIEKVWLKARENAFYRGIPFIWCSNNLTVSFAIQCYWYRQLSGDSSYLPLEQACVDWIFGCNPWGTSFVYGLPAGSDTPVDPHSAFTHIKKYPIDGGLVDGPVYGSIYGNLIGITLYDTDEYALFQSDLAVYHDDYGDYSTNEPTMDGTASLIYLLAAMEYESKLHQARPIANGKKSFTTMQGAVVRSDRTRRSVALVFTADEFADGLSHISQVLERQNIPASFFLTGRFLQQGGNADAVRNLISNEHYIGPHSDQHLLYCDWTKRDSLLVTRQAFTADLEENYRKLAHLGLSKKTARWFLPPYEWYNDSIAAWTADMGLQLVNFTAGTFSHADYTTPGMKNYRDSENIYHSITSYESSSEDGLNGFILLLHAGVSPERTDKFYHRLDDLINYLKKRGYTFSRINDLLQ